MCAALALTLSADFFLLVLDAWYALGVALFCGVQGLYLARLRAMGAGLWIPLRLGLTAAALLAAALLGLLTPLNALALVYFPELVCNAAAALSLGRRGRMFGLGLLLFVGCDVCVGLHNLAGLPVPLSAFAQVGHVAVLPALPGAHRPIHPKGVIPMRPSKPASVLLSLVLALLVLSFSISVPILFRPFYYVQIDALHLPEQTGWSAEVIREAYDEVLDFCVFGAPFGTGELAWSESGPQPLRRRAGALSPGFCRAGG